MAAKKETFQSENFNVKKYIDADLQDVIKLEGISSKTEYLENIRDILDEKRKDLQREAQKFSQKDSKEMTQARENKTYRAIKDLTEEFGRVKGQIATSKDAVGEQIKTTKMVKRKVDKILKEKEKILAEIFVLDLVQHMKINEDSSAKIASMDDKIKFAKNIKEIENLVSMYEKALLPKLVDLTSKVEEEFTSRLGREIDAKKFEHSGEILEYFALAQKEDVVFDIFCQHYILSVNFGAVTNAFNSQNVESITIMFDRYFELVATFYDKARSKEAHLIKYFNEAMFNKLTGFFFERYLARFFDIILAKNLRSNSQFFLEYLEQVSGLLQNYAPKFEEVAKQSLLLEELLDNYRISALARYFEEYFAIEEKYFGYCTGIYLNLLRDRLNNIFNGKRPNVFEAAIEVLSGEKMEEYLNFVSKSLKRVIVLSDQSLLAANLVKLLKVALAEYKAFMDFVVENLMQLIPPGGKEFVSPAALRANSFLFLLVNRVYVMNSEFIMMVQSSIYFVEIDNLKRAVFDSVKEKILELNKRVVANIITATAQALAAPPDKKAVSESAGVLERCFPFCSRYMQEIEGLKFPDFKKAAQVLFYRELIALVDETLFKMDKRVRAKINYVNEFKLFFEIFNKVKIKNLEGDIYALQYLLLCLKTGERDIWRLVDQPTREIINSEKMEKYNAFLIKNK